jgi:hypothetical protein
MSEPLVTLRKDLQILVNEINTLLNTLENTYNSNNIPAAKAALNAIIVKNNALKAKRTSIVLILQQQLFDQTVGQLETRINNAKMGILGKICWPPLRPPIFPLAK